MGEKALIGEIAELVGRRIWGAAGMETRLRLGDQSITFRVVSVCMYNSHTDYELEDSQKNRTTVLDLFQSFKNDDLQDLSGQIFTVEVLNGLPDDLDEYSIPLEFYRRFDALPPFVPRTDEELLEKIKQCGAPIMYMEYLPYHVGKQFLTPEEDKRYQYALSDYSFRSIEGWDFRPIFERYVFHICSTLLNFRSIKSSSFSARVYPHTLQHYAYLLRFDSVYQKARSIRVTGPLTVADLMVFALFELGFGKSQFLKERMDELEEVMELW